MYIPGSNRIEDVETMIRFMEANNFAIIVSSSDNIPVATHIPLTLSRKYDTVLLRGHFAKANHQWETLANQEILVIFSGPHAYISPSHYDKQESVPTWNYVAVHAYGKAELILANEHPERLETILTDLMTSSESAYLDQWQGLSARYKDGMKQGIVGVEILVSRLEGKAKLSQNKTPQEQERIAQTLSSSQTTHIMEIGHMMQNSVTPK